MGDHECIHCGECISVCPAKAITWKGSSLFVRKNDVDTPIDSDIKPLSAILKASAIKEEVAVSEDTEVNCND